MKYIRTKDGIYEADVLSIHYIGETHFSCWNIEHTRAFNEWHIIKQADTIAELCDCIVYDCLPRPYQDAYHKHEIGNIESLKWNRKPEKFENIYGAIWTDKGLIYVAKMNEKGELELL